MTSDDWDLAYRAAHRETIRAGKRLDRAKRRAADADRILDALGARLPAPVRLYREDPVVNIAGPKVIRASDLCPVALATSFGPGTHNFKPVRENEAHSPYVETCTACGATWRDGKIIPGPDPATKGTPK